MTNREIVARWKRDVCQKDVDPGGEHDWHSIWVGFVIACNRPDLADYENYMNLGFPHE